VFYLTSTHSYQETNNPILPLHFVQTLILNHSPNSPKWFLMFRFCKQTLHSFLLSLYACYMPHIYLFPCYDYINNMWWRVTVMTFATESSASLFSQLLRTSNIFLATLLSKTLNLCSSLDVRHQITHPHKMTSTMSVWQMNTRNILSWMVVLLSLLVRTKTQLARAGLHVPSQGIFTCRLNHTDFKVSALATDNRSFILFLT